MMSYAHSHSGVLTKEGGQKLAHLFWLLFMGPMASSIHHMDPFELRVARLADVHGAAHRPIGAPVLSSYDGLCWDVDRAPRERQLLGNGRLEGIVAPAPIFLQRAGPAAVRVFLPIDIALRLGQPLASLYISGVRHGRRDRGRHALVP